MIRIRKIFVVLIFVSLSLLIENSHCELKTSSSYNIIQRRRDKRYLQKKNSKHKNSDTHDEQQLISTYNRFQDTTPIDYDADDDDNDDDSNHKATNDDNGSTEDKVYKSSLDSMLDAVSSNDDSVSNDDDEKRKKKLDDNVDLNNEDINRVFDMLFKNPEMQSKFLDSLETKGINTKIERKMKIMPTNVPTVSPTQRPRTPTLSRPIPPRPFTDTPSNQPVIADPSPSKCQPSGSSGGGMGKGKGKTPTYGMGQEGMKMGQGKGMNSNPITICPEEPTMSPSISLFPTQKDNDTSAPTLVQVPKRAPQKNMKNSSKKMKKCSGMGMGGCVTSAPTRGKNPTRKPTMKPAVSVPTIQSDLPTTTPFPTSTTFPPTTELIPTSIPTPEPTSRPICVPTSGTCSIDEIELQASIRNATNGDIVAICDNAVLDVTEAIITLPEQSGLTICCSVGCTLAGTGNDSLMFLEGPSVTLFGITFINGRSTEFNGGNVGIETSGDVSVIKCTFRNGFSNETGGNLFVAMDNGGTVLIEDCMFENGSATSAGGGVSVFDASLITISDSIFINNTALGTAEGGGFYANKNPTITDFDQDITITGSSFTNNKARAGAGFLVFDLGVNATVQVKNNQFNENKAEVAAAGGILSSLLQTNIAIDKNSGSNNAGGICDGFLTFRTQSDGICISLTDSFNNTVP
jgi:hypothetical protein